jgi:hypothetical protein
MQVKNQWENAKLRDIINPPSTTVQNLKLLLLVVTDITCARDCYWLLYNNIKNSCNFFGREPWSIRGQTHGITSLVF